MSATAPIDSRKLRWLTSILGLSIGVGFLPWHPALETAGLGAAAGFCALLCLQFGWLLFARLQCSLLELWLFVALLGSLEGLLWTTPGFDALGGLQYLIALLGVAWLTYALVLALVQARLLQVTQPAARIALFLANVWSTSALALLVAGILLHQKSIGPITLGGSLTNAALPFLIAGAMGLLLSFVLQLKTRRAARALTAASHT